MNGLRFAAYTPVWMRIALILVTGPAMIAGAAIREKANRNQNQH